MPITPTYPGVYIEEIPSGVRTITGVSTSVTAFVGSAKRGPINEAVRCLSISDYERRFGGLDATSELSYAVRQFFLNGGSEAWIVRLAKNAVAATATLDNEAAAPTLTLTALDEGRAGNRIELRVDYDTPNPASTFSLRLDYTSPDNPTENATETFQNLSMNRQDLRYAPDVINGVSPLVAAESEVTPSMLAALGAGNSTSGPIADAGGNMLDVATLLDPAHNQFRVQVNGLSPVPVQIALPADIGGTTPTQRLTSLCAAVQAKVRAAAAGEAALSGFTCARQGNRIVMTSGAAGEASSVRALPGERNDASARLKLGTLNGGVEADAAAALRPVEMPDPGTLVSGTFGANDLDAIPSSTENSFLISLDGGVPDPVNVGDTAAAGANLDAKLADVADRVAAAVRALRPANPAYRNFTCVADTSNKTLRLASGTRGAGSSVLVSAAPTNSVADKLHLLAGATAAPGVNATLTGGDEQPYTDADAYNLFIADRSQRKGVYALDEVDLFNLLCLPAVTDAGILQDAAAYCVERRAFLIVDAPRSASKPDDMVTTIAGPALPKSDHAAVYYPWIRTADPLRSGKLRSSAPSGTIAGLFARIDSSRGVWKAPAGTDATLTGALGVDHLLTDAENGILNPLGVNAVRAFPGYGTVAWGARTLRGSDQLASEYKYVPVRRLALYIEESLFRGTKWVVFEPNDEPLWAQIRLNIGAFMHNLFRQGAFQGKTPRAAYLVKCDAETTTQNDINLGIVNILVGFAPLKPAEFVFIRIQQLAGQIES
jgi:hypothetical protein